MVKTRAVCGLALLSVLVSGCSTLGLSEQKEAKVKKLTPNTEIAMASVPAQLRGVYIRDNAPANSYTLCAEPFSDVAASSSAKAALEATNKLNAILNSQTSATTSLGTNNDLQQTAKGTAEFVNTIVALDGRTQYVLLAREMMFRTCEAASNGWLGTTPAVVADNLRKNHLEIIQALTSMVNAEKSKAVAQSNAAVASAIKNVSDGKLDESILKNLSPVSSTVKESMTKTFLACVNLAKDDKEKARCAQSYADDTGSL